MSSVLDEEDVESAGFWFGCAVGQGLVKVGLHLSHPGTSQVHPYCAAGKDALVS